MLLIKKWWQKRSGDECQVTLTSKLPSARLLRLYFYASSPIIFILHIENVDVNECLIHLH